MGESARKSNYARDVSDRTENRSRSVEYNTGLVEVIRRSRGFDEDPNLFNSASVHASPVKVAGKGERAAARRISAAGRGNGAEQSRTRR